MDNQNVLNKFSLTGFMILTSILLVLFSTLPALMLSTIFSVYWIIGMLLFAVLGAAVYFLGKKLKSNQTKFIGIVYVAQLIVISTLGFGVILILFVGLQASTHLSLILLTYIVMSIIGSILALFGLSFELRDLASNKSKLVYIINLVSSLIIYLALIKFLLFDYIRLTPLSIIVGIVSCVLCCFYMQLKVKKFMRKYDYDKIEERYRLIISITSSYLLAPILLPATIYEYLTGEGDYERL